MKIFGSNRICHLLPLPLKSWGIAGFTSCNFDYRLTVLFYILETNQLLEITEANSEFVNSVGNEKLLLQPAISDVQCAVLTDVLENQIPKSTSKCFA